MPKLQDIIDYCHQWAPPETAAPWDNVGLQLGQTNAEIQTITLSLDVDLQALDYVEAHNSDLLITHHPIYFNPIKTLDFNSDIGQITKRLIQNNTHVFSMHTNLDAANDGVTDTLIEHYGWDPSQASPISDDQICRQLNLSHPLSIEEIAKKHPCRVVGKKDQSINSIAFCGGSGRSMLKRISDQQIPALITGELGYHDEVFCDFAGITAFLLGHKESETPILYKIKEKLSQQFSDLKIEVII